MPYSLILPQEKLLPEERRIVDIDSQDFTSNMSVYPNPASHYINIRYNLQEYETLSLRIIDMTGRVVYESLLSQSQDEVVIPTTEYPAGHYTSAIYSNNQILESQKFIITK